jgi:hypothetical protein
VPLSSRCSISSRPPLYFFRRRRLYLEIEANMNNPISRLVLIPVFILIFIVESIFIFFTFRPIGVTFFKRCWIQFFFLTDIGPSFF